MLTLRHFFFQIFNRLSIYMPELISFLYFYSGVLWSGDNIIGRANDAVNKLRSLGKKIFYVTNNSTKSRDEYVKKCEKLGFIASKVCLNIWVLLIGGNAELLEILNICFVLLIWCWIMIEYTKRQLFNCDTRALCFGTACISWNLLRFYCTQEEIVSSSFVMAQYLKQQGFNKKVYVVGTSGMTAELDNVGIAHTDIGVRLSNEPMLLWWSLNDHSSKHFVTFPYITA